VNATTVTGGSTVAATGLGQIPALYAQAYTSASGSQSVVITNKSATAQQVTVRVNGSAVGGSLPIQFITGSDPGTLNTSSTQLAISIQTMNSPNPIPVPPYSVVRVDLNGGVTIQTNPPGLEFSVDGSAQTAPQTLHLSQGPHTIAVMTTQPGSAGTQYVFTGWSDSGAAAHSIGVSSSPATYTASFKAQYQLTISASPAGGGSVTPPSGAFYDGGTAVPVAATASSGYSFTSWTGPVASATSASTTVTMNVPQTLTANFSGSGGHPGFFSGEDFLGGIAYYLQFPNGNLFGYYEYLSSSILYHFDMGYEAFLPGSGGSIYFYDFASGHWWYTSPSLFPNLYDFALGTWIYYFPNTTNPRYFSNLTTGKIFTM
jgi:hypothetical protein